MHVALALQHLHQNSIVHIDLKFWNVGLDNDVSVKLINFRCGRYLKKSYATYSILGAALQKISEELVSNLDANPSTAMDTWSLESFCHTALFGSYLFKANHSCNQQPTKDHFSELTASYMVLRIPFWLTPQFLLISDVSYQNSLKPDVQTNLHLPNFGYSWLRSKSHLCSWQFMVSLRILPPRHVAKLWLQETFCRYCTFRFWPRPLQKPSVYTLETKLHPGSYNPSSQPTRLSALISSAISTFVFFN